jgi:hypothetical protein
VDDERDFHEGLREVLRVHSDANGLVGSVCDGRREYVHVRDEFAGTLIIHAARCKYLDSNSSGVAGAGDEQLQKGDGSSEYGDCAPKKDDLRRDVAVERVGQ